MSALHDRGEALEAKVRSALRGEYEDLRYLGKGGMAVVYTGINRRLGRKEALKIMSGIGRPDPEHLRGFDLECRALASLNHPNIITIFNAGVDEEHGLAWLAQEFIEGETLRERLRYGPMRMDDGLCAAIDLLKALGHAHGREIIHRDIKPENIFLESSGRVVLADFGIALLSGSRAPDSPGAPPSGRPAGTAAYMSPEHLRGEPLHRASDLYAYGLVLYEIFTGRHPFSTPDPEATAHRQLRESPRSPKAVQPDLPDELSRLILDLLQKDHRRRPSSAAEVQSRLQQILMEEPTGDVEALSEVGARGKTARIRWIGGAVIVGGTVAALLLWLGPGANQGEQTATRSSEAFFQAPAEQASSGHEAGSPDTEPPAAGPGNGDGRGGNEQVLSGGAIQETTDRPGGPDASGHDPAPDRTRGVSSFLRVALSGDKGAAHGSVILLDGIEQPLRAPAVIMTPPGADSCRIELRKFGVRFEPRESVVSGIPPGDTLEVRFSAMADGSSPW